MQCRACLSDGSTVHVNMQTSLVNGINLFDYFNKCTQLDASMDDGLPATLCLNCSSDLQTAYNFVEGARKADATLRLILSVRNQIAEVPQNISLIEGPVVAKIERVATDEVEKSKAADLDPLGNVEVIEEKLNIEELSEEIEREEEYIEEKCESEKEFYDESVKQRRASSENSMNITFAESESKSETTSEDEAWQEVANNLDAITRKTRAVSVFSCELCHTDFPLKHDLVKHLFEEHKSKVTCEECPKDFNFPNELELHNELVHGRDSPVQCFYCPESAPTSRADLVKHFRYKHSHRYSKYFPTKKRKETGKFQCSICNRYCITSTLYSDHMQAHTNEKAFKCKFCPMEFKLRRTFQAHLKRKHDATGNVAAYQRESENLIAFQWRKEDQASDDESEIEESVTTYEKKNEKSTAEKNNDPQDNIIVSQSESEENFPGWQSDDAIEQSTVEDSIKVYRIEGDKRKNAVKKYLRRSKRKKSEASNSFQCEICKYYCSSTALLDDHMLLMHADDNPYKCSLCPMSFSTNRNYQAHMTRRHRLHVVDINDEEKQIECTECKIHFSALDYKRHKEWHRKQNKNKFLCSFCPRLFSSNKVLKTHENVIHLNEKQETRKCPICNKDIYLSYWRAHMTKIHPTGRKFACHICGNTFKAQSQLDCHLKLHGSEREFRCSVCNKGYIGRYDLKVHMRTHTGEKPYDCHLCDKSFAMKGRLTYHLQRHAGIKHRCKVCGKEYNFLSLLRKHSYTHTGMPYHCPACGYACVLRDVFTRHLQRMHDIVMTEDELLAMFKENTGRMPRIQPMEDFRETAD